MQSAALVVASPASTSSEATHDSVSTRRKTRVSAEHTLNRVRENQRKHRARQRSHVTMLEEKLAHTERLLTEARAEIASLKAEQTAANTIYQFNRLKPQESIPSSRKKVPEVLDEASHSQKQQGLSLVEPNGHMQLDYPNNALPDLSFLGGTITPALFITREGSPSIETYMSIGGPPPCCTDPPSSPVPDEPLSPECSTCKTRPPPAPTESTTLCAQAYVMISQQNFRNLDPETIRSWLAKGYRRAQREGEGCRVENGALLRLLDYISGL